MGEGALDFKFLPAGGQFHLRGSDEALTPYGGLVAWTYDKQDKRKNYQVAQICISGPYGSWDSEGCLHLRHAKRANILFLDGHAQAMVPQEIRNMLNDYNRSTTPFYYWDENLKDNVQR
jgi:prepilin-type processing-associated H-X9-DG protein